MRVAARAVFVLVLLATPGCSTHTAAPRSISVSVSLVRGDEYVPGRVTASKADGTVVASARQSGSPGGAVNFTLHRDTTYTFRGYADDGARCSPSASSAEKSPAGSEPAWTVTVRCS